MTGEPLVQVGGPLSAGEAGFLQDALEGRGVAAGVVVEAEAPHTARVMVPAADLQRALYVRREVLGDEVPEEAHPGGRAGGKAWLATGVAFASVLYLGKTLPAAARGLVGVAVAAVVYLACSAGGGTDGEPPREPPGAQEKE